MAPAKRSYQIRNMSKWVGKSIIRFNNTLELMWDYMDEGFTVCEWTKKLITIADYEAAFSSFSYEEQERIHNNPNYDECYYYSEEALQHFAA